MFFLYELLEKEFGKRGIEGVEVPDSILKNMKHTQRPYQIEAYQRFILYYTEKYFTHRTIPIHTLFNMATGSGKTHIMAGLILYLYEQGYRNFLFFVNSTNIILKTKDNFLNSQASKYLFKRNIDINGNDVLIKEVDNFDEADNRNINIKFTTIQQLHYDLNEPKENSLTYEDFENKKIVLIADEAHHLVAGTKSRQTEIVDTWESTVQRIHKSNHSNILLEFTATIDTEKGILAEHYRDKVIYKYDLSQYRIDKYSKEINLIRSHYDEQDRIIQALILNQYRQELAIDNNINLKPVILFKAKKTIAESEENKVKFHKLIENLSIEQIEKVRNTSTIPIVQKAYKFFEKKDLSDVGLIGRLKNNFREDNCLSANSEGETEINQILLNTLEDEDNPIRAIFAVQKLNEGWDVLNLFDIVRLYSGRDVKDKRAGKTTISEAQLIGRGARYFPFALELGQDKYTRKYDDDIANDLKILEELYYHTENDVRYISELKQVLVETGIFVDDEDLETKKLILKDSFKETSFYKNGQVFSNKRLKKDYNNQDLFTKIKAANITVEHNISSGVGSVTSAFFELENPPSKGEVIKQKDCKIKDIQRHIVRYALHSNPYFYFSAISQFFPMLESLTEFIENKAIADITIKFNGTEQALADINNLDYLQAVEKVLKAIERVIKENISEYTGSKFEPQLLRGVFKDKEIRVNKNDERAKGQEDLVSNEDWYVYNANYGTSEEKEFVKLIARRFEDLQEKYENIYLIRNERALKIFDNNGRQFEPDFLLFCKQKDKPQPLTYQVFIEPKGRHLELLDKWKEDYLNHLRRKHEIRTIDTDNYLITALPFYNTNKENDFNNIFREELGV